MTGFRLTAEARKVMLGDLSDVVLDLFCGDGGAARGYMAAGYRVIGVDRDDHSRHYPGAFVQGDALEFLAEFGWLFKRRHASPPCQGYSIATAGTLARFNHQRLIGVTRELIQAHPGQWVIENVELAARQMRNPVMLCGRMFDLTAVDEDGAKLVLDRHRLFESNFLPEPPLHPVHGDELVGGVYGGSRRAKRERGESLSSVAPRDRYEAKHVRKGGYVPRSRRVKERLLGLPADVMTLKGMDECIPPVYAEWVGRRLS
jgi:DNA (cytosine-5)-methyltransferase 1